MESKAYLWIKATERIKGEDKGKISYFLYANFSSKPVYEKFLCHQQDKIGHHIYNVIKKEEIGQIRLMSNTSILELEDLVKIKKKLKKKFKKNNSKIKIKLEKAL